MNVGVVDIGTNSMRLLVTDGVEELHRIEEVTGLGRGVDSSGVLSEPRVIETLAVFERFSRIMGDSGVERRIAIATSASRDAANRNEFFDRAETALGVRPTLISGDEEARFAYRGATAGFEGEWPVLVSDIGGGSTEFVTEQEGISIDVGSVRVTERTIFSRVATPQEVAAARQMVADAFESLPEFEVATLIGVAGTWTSIASVARALPKGASVHGREVGRTEVDQIAEILSRLTVEETAELPGLEPKRAPVFLGGVLVAAGVMEALGVGRVVVSERDTLDGVAMSLLDLP